MSFYDFFFVTDRIGSETSHKLQNESPAQKRSLLAHDLFILMDSAIMWTHFRKQLLLPCSGTPWPLHQQIYWNRTWHFHQISFKDHLMWILLPRKHLLLLLSLVVLVVVAVVVVVVVMVVVVIVEVTAVVVVKSWPELVNNKSEARASKHKLGARAGKYKSGARTDKYKLGTRAVKYKLGARAEGLGPGLEAGKYKYSRK